jgi:hypothetical protein
MDDHLLALRARGTPTIDGLAAPGWDLFAFTTGEPAANQRLIERGVMLPWWSDPRLKIAFFRPLSSLSHRLDGALWPQEPRLMYLHSVAWLALTLHLAARWYRSVEAVPGLALLAGLLYAVDDARGPVVAWLSNRNALIATSFGLLSLLAHARFRRDGRKLWGLCAAAALLLALLGGELGLGTLAYLFAYAVFIDRGPALERARALLPHAAALVIWLVSYRASGAAVVGSGTYLSPLQDLGTFLAALPLRACALLAASFGPVSADLELLRGSNGALLRLAGAALVLGVASYALWSALRDDSKARFWLVATLLSVLPVAASPPGDRLLPFVGIGAAALLARIIEPVLSGALGRARSRGRWLVGLAFAALHGLLAPLLLPFRAAQMQLLGRAQQNASSLLDRIPSLEHRTVVIVNAPVDLLASYVQLERAARGAKMAEHLYWLTSAGSSISVRRSDDETLLLERADGFFSAPLERHYRRDPGALAVGSNVRLAEMTAEVQRVTADGRPQTVSFRFASALESSRYVFLIWKDDRYQPLELRELKGRPLRLPAEDLPAILARTALGAT